MPDTRPIRCFLGVPVDATFTARLQPLLADLQLQPWARSLRWVESSNLHLTLAFLGDQPLELIQSLQRELLAPLAALPRFQLQSHCLSTFPDAKSAIVALEFHSCSELQKLKDVLDEALLRQGLAPDPRPLRPHLTLARGRRGQRLPLQPQPCTLTLPLQEMILFQSVPGTAGNDYQPLWSVALANSAPTPD